MKFVECMEKEIREIAKIYGNKFPMEMTDVDKESFEASTKCHICCETLGQDKVPDHNHLTGKFRGEAHNKCNFGFKNFQNLYPSYSTILVDMTLTFL